ncbi:hypothetical protein IFM89_004662 [Coptis chinensis]|uniref:B box-type domain-containing protein n=1 Tax=Coptis chinensis TaxID=261450 RepID=A0A835I997_9MAGN|nr:hypothetical protein IFM89_004662 [Coptis chinensis]
MKDKVTCELCNVEASLYCMSDSAFLCYNCDARVHEANFLVARHVRRTICSICKRFDGNHVSGVDFRHIQITCRSCVSDSDSDISCTSSSTCISSSTSFPLGATKSKKINSVQKKIVSENSGSGISSDISDIPVKVSNREIVKKESVLEVKAKGILVNWCRKLGVATMYSSLALQVFSISLRKFTNLPFRVCLVSSFWLSMKLQGATAMYAFQILKRLEQISGVPAKLILLAENRLSRVLRINRRSKLDVKEGWDECSN